MFRKHRRDFSHIFLLSQFFLYYMRQFWGQQSCTSYTRSYILELSVSILCRLYGPSFAYESINIIILIVPIIC